MADKYGMGAQAIHNLCYIRNITSNAMPTNTIPSLAVAMSAQAERMDFIACLREIRKKILPAPCSVPGTMYQQQRNRMDLFERLL